MTTPIETSVELANGDILAMCPLCQGHGYVDSMANQLGPGIRNPHGNSMPTCRLCKGHKFVYLNKTCTCGSAAVWYDATKKIWYCGRPLCADIIAGRTAGYQEWVGA